MDSMLVLTGSHRGRDLLAAEPAERPTHLGRDLAALFQPPLRAVERRAAFDAARFARWRMARSSSMAHQRQGPSCPVGRSTAPLAGARRGPDPEC